MRGRSHIALGIFLTEAFFPELSDRERKAFLLGCIEPDRNPASYLKGSLHVRFLQGHNYENAASFLERKLQRLERRSHWKLWDWYTFGKVIHYTADSFTYPHNADFPGDLMQHRIYEVQLQTAFLSFLNAPYCRNTGHDLPVEQVIRCFHKQYCQLPGTPLRDSEFALSACCHLSSAFCPKIDKTAVAFR